VDPDSAEWPYVQVAAQLRQQIASGALSGRLPSIMDLAERMSVAPRTVQRALSVLRDEGLIYSVPGRGTFVRR
jgi:DNA-binding GntR family transcriptional regulator